MSAKDLVAIIDSNASKERFARYLQGHLSPDSFAKTLSTAILNNPKLANADAESLLREACELAALGLSCNPQLGEGYLIADYKGKVQRRVGYRGLIKLSRRGGIRTIYAEAVHENDEHVIHRGTEPKLEHKPALKDRGDPIFYYAVMIGEDGAKDFEYMDMEDLDRIRDEKSDGWKAYKANKISSTPWATDDAEMRKKTVLRRLLKRAPLQAEAAEKMASALDAEDSAEMAKDITPEKTALPRTKVSSMDDIVAFHSQQPKETVVNSDGEIIFDEDQGLSVWMSESNPGVSAEDAKSAFTAIGQRVKFLKSNDDTEGALKVLKMNQIFISTLTDKQQATLKGLI